jgi:hypothetical protein
MLFALYSAVNCNNLIFFNFFFFLSVLNIFQEIVTMVIKRLRFWPVSNVFDQWKEFTARQRELKVATKQVQDLHVQLQQKMVFRIWKECYEGSSKARLQSVGHHKPLILWSTSIMLPLWATGSSIDPVGFK